MESSARSPNAQLTISKLARDPPNHKAEDQAKSLSRAGIRDTKNAARKTLLTVQPARTPENANSLIQQAKTKPKFAFLDRSVQAVQKQCPNEAAHPH